MNGKPEFHEDYAAPDSDPLFPTHEDFPYDEIDRRLGQETEEVRHDVREALAGVLGIILRHIVRDVLKPNADRLAGRRAITLAWVYNPALCEGASLTRMAEALRIPPRTLQYHAAAASAVFGITNHGQSHGWNRGIKERHTRCHTLKTEVPWLPKQRRGLRFQLRNQE